MKERYVIGVKGGLVEAWKWVKEHNPNTITVVSVSLGKDIYDNDIALITYDRERA